MIRYLWTHSGQPPGEYLTFRLCRDVYHCRPSELEQEDLKTVLAHLICLSIETQVQIREAEDRKIFG